MAGPTATILCSQDSEAVFDVVHPALEEMATRHDKNDFWFEERPFIVTYGEEYRGALAEVVESGLPEVLGWTPQGCLTFAAMCNREMDHRILAELCVRFGRQLKGVVGLGAELFDGPILDRGSLSPAVRVENPNGAPGFICATSYLATDGSYATTHYASAEYLEVWQKHPRLRMTK